MRSMADTIERLARLRSMPSPTPVASSLSPLTGFGSNPGALAGWYHVPKDLPAAPALVVVLHGCTQTAAGYDHGSGWSKLGEDYGFAVLFPEQTRANNANLCFNWFQDEDTRRDSGEALSIRQMIDAMVSAHGIDRRRVFITGLSAGGAMANTMLACYPEVFASGAIIAGLPHAVASSVPEAFDRMRGHGLPKTASLQERLKGASSHEGPWPTLSIWHGTADNTVAIANAEAIVEQWHGVHRLGKPESDHGGGHIRTVWQDSDGATAIELYRIAQMSHGTPLDVASGYGVSAPFMLDVGLSSTVEIAGKWGLTASFERREKTTMQDEGVSGFSSTYSKPAGDNLIQSVIENALRSAGLMR